MDNSDSKQSEKPNLQSAVGFSKAKIRTKLEVGKGSSVIIERRLKQGIFAITIVFPLLTIFRQLTILTSSAWEPQWKSDSSLQINDTRAESPFPLVSNPRRPLLRTILNFTSSEIIGNPDGLLDFAIAGFPKCGTTAFQNWLSQHPQIAMLVGEAFPLMNQKPHLLIWRLFTQLPAEPNNLLRGYKNPLDIRAPPSLEAFKQHFPSATLIIGVRHPVRWFESFYNFKVQNLPPQIDPSFWGDPNLLVDKCEDWSDSSCLGTAKGWFHVHLAALGKVPFPEKWRSEYPRYLQNVSHHQNKVPNKIFLYESNQLVFGKDKGVTTASDDDTETFGRQFRQDLENLLGLNSSLPTVMSRTKPDFDHFNKRQQRRKNLQKIRICDSIYAPLRDALMQVSRQTSIWIREEFIQSPDVQVSSPDYFVRLMEAWMQDPCD